MNIQRNLAIGVALAALATGGIAVAHESPGHGHGPRHHHGERDHRRHQAKVHWQRKDAHGDHRSDRRDRRFERRVDKRQDKQLSRISKGWRSGDLTRREFKDLKRQQHRIERMQQRFDDDGRYSKAERKRLKAALERADRRIHAARHDRDRRHHRRGHDWKRERYSYSYSWPSYRRWPHWYHWRD
jgi:hypothetical protein